eukprot:2064675-Amphidinium_carterae.1
MEPIMAKSPADPFEVGSTVDGLSPRRLDDVLVDNEKSHAAQLAASQFSDGTTLSASAAIATAAQQRQVK